MIFIKKSSAPDKLVAYLQQPHSPDFNALDSDVKDAIRESLILEQCYLCAYCNSRISIESTRIEHFVPQSDPVHGTDLALDYSNMLLSCDTSNLEEAKTCDDFKGNKLLPISPLKKSDMETISYSKDGTIRSSNPEYDKALNKVLNLNTPQLKRNRKAAWEEAVNLLSRRCNRGAWDASKIRKYLERTTTPDQEGRLPEYCGIIRYFLSQRLNRDV